MARNRRLPGQRIERAANRLTPGPPSRTRPTSSRPPNPQSAPVREDRTEPRRERIGSKLTAGSVETGDLPPGRWIQTGPKRPPGWWRGMAKREPGPAVVGNHLGDGCLPARRLDLRLSYETTCNVQCGGFRQRVALAVLPGRWVQTGPKRPPGWWRGTAKGAGSGNGGPMLARIRLGTAIRCFQQSTCGEQPGPPNPGGTPARLPPPPPLKKVFHGQCSGKISGPVVAPQRLTATTGEVRSGGEGTRRAGRPASHCGKPPR
jgi:hypothetical protein